MKSFRKWHFRHPLIIITTHTIAWFSANATFFFRARDVTPVFFTVLASSQFSSLVFELPLTKEPEGVLKSEPLAEEEHGEPCGSPTDESWEACESMTDEPWEACESLTDESWEPFGSLGRVVHWALSDCLFSLAGLSSFEAAKEKKVEVYKTRCQLYNHSKLGKQPCHIPSPRT